MLKVGFVTGAGRGLGKGFADFLSKEGFIVYAGVRTITCHKNYQNIRHIQLDVQDDESIRGAISKIEEGQGRIDLLVNNAGVNKDTSTHNHKELVTHLSSLNRQSLLKMFDINALGLLMVAKQALKLMTKPNTFIINISSNRASLQQAGNDSSASYGYKVSKAALNMSTKAMLFDLPNNVSVIAVHPGGVHTDMNPAGSLEPEEAASRIYEIVQNWDSKLNGNFVKNDGALYPN